ncbi:hypothetical protein IIC44_02325 [Patescibacteria group bacterium]|nr:hypothetical protein [Patescibacteria group bacterium]
MDIVALYQERLKKLSEIVELTDFFFIKELTYEKELLSWKGMGEQEIIESLGKTEKLLYEIKENDWKKEELEKILIKEAEAMGDKGKLLWPLRVALTGKKSSAGPFDVAFVLKKEKVLQRIEQAKKKLQ